MMKKKIMFIVPSMRGGGSERVISLLVQHLDRKKFDITLLLLKKEGPYLKDLPDDIENIDLDTPRLRQAILKIPKIIKKIQPDILISTLSHLNIYFAILRPFFGRKINFIARESSIVSVNNKQTFSPFLFNALYKIFYSNFDKIISQSNYMKDDLVTNFGIQSNKITVINNPVNFSSIKILSNQAESLFPKYKTNLLAVGRLGKEKGYDLLLKAVQQLDETFHLTIVGQGAEEFSLKHLVDELQIEDKVSFVGFQENPYSYMKQADIFVLSSRYEGFPNVVLEANACGTPVVAFDCPGGTREIIEDGINGFLAECGNIDALVEKILSSSIYSWNINKILNLINLKYNVDYITQQYEHILYNE